MYLNNFLKEIREGTIFGSPAVYIMTVVEFQKRGLPHAHIAFRVAGQQPMTAAQLDEYVSARVPVVPTEGELLAQLGDIPLTPTPCDDDTAAILQHMRALRASVRDVVASAGDAVKIVAALTQSTPAAVSERHGRNRAQTPLAARCSAMIAALKAAAAAYDCRHLVTTLMMHRECVPDRCYKRRETRAGASSTALPDTSECGTVCTALCFELHTCPTVSFALAVTAGPANTCKYGFPYAMCSSTHFDHNGCVVHRREEVRRPCLRPVVTFSPQQSCAVLLTSRLCCASRLSMPSWCLTTQRPFYASAATSTFSTHTLPGS
jgi:hypothetical protein